MIFSSVLIKKNANLLRPLGAVSQDRLTQHILRPA